MVRSGVDFSWNTNYAEINQVQQFGSAKNNFVKIFSCHVDSITGELT